MNDEAPKNPFEELSRILKTHDKCSKAINDRLDKVVEKAEQETLMKLWAELGDSKFSYYTVLRAGKEFITALDAIRKMDVCLDLHIILLNALKECINHDIESLKIVREEKLRHKLDQDLE